MKKLATLLLITLSNFAFGNVYLMVEAIKANDIEALESILKNTDANDSQPWEYTITHALSSSPKSILPLLKFYHKNGFHLAELTAYQSETAFQNLLAILKLNDEEISSLAIKYYKNSFPGIDKIHPYHPIIYPPESISIDSLNLLLTNELSPEIYAEAVSSKIHSILNSNNINELKSLLEKIVINQDIIKFWNNKKFGISFIQYNKEYSLELLTELALFCCKNKIKLEIYDSHLFEIIKNTDAENASLVIECYPHLIKEIYAFYQPHTIFLQSIPTAVLNILLKNGLPENSYVHAISSQITELSKDNKTDAIESLLENVVVNDENKDIWQGHYLDPENSPASVMPYLQFAAKHDIQLIQNTWTLSRILKNCDEETSSLAITMYPNLVQELNGGHIDAKTLNSFSINLLNLLFDKGFQIQPHVLTELTTLDNGPKILENQIQKNPAFLLDNREEFSSFMESIISNNRFDFLEVLSQYDINLETLNTTFPSIDTEDLIFEAVRSTSNGNHSMLNHVLNTLNFHGNPMVLASAAGLSNSTLFDDLLTKGYAADPNPSALSNMSGLLLAIFGSDFISKDASDSVLKLQRQNLNAIRYYLEQGVDPNTVITSLGYGLPDNFEALDLLLSYGFKIENLHIAVAANQGSLKLIKYFKENGYNTKHPAIFVAACESKNIELIDLLLDDGANIKDPNVLVSAARGNHLEVVQHLVEKGSQSN